jgi:hypothetical protein
MQIFVRTTAQRCERFNLINYGYAFETKNVKIYTCPEAHPS